jgi:hypothetical protein
LKTVLRISSGGCRMAVALVQIQRGKQIIFRLQGVESEVNVL